MFKRKTNRTPPHEGIRFGGVREERDRLVAAEVQGANGDGRTREGVEHPLILHDLFVFRGEVRIGEKEEFGAIESDSTCSDSFRFGRIVGAIEIASNSIGSPSLVVVGRPASAANVFPSCTNSRRRLA